MVGGGRGRDGARLFGVLGSGAACAEETEVE